MANSESTIYDIAAEAGVSITTVSRVMRNSGSVSQATREKVEAAIARHNYHPSAIAQGMTSKKTYILGMILPKLLNPNYAMLFTGANDEARHNGHLISLFPMRGIIGDESETTPPALSLASRRLDGLIVCVEYLPPRQKERLQETLWELRQYMPIVLIGCVPSYLDYPTISYPMADMTRKAVSYLVSLGHERIALIGGTEEDQDENRRDVGYLEGLKDAHLPFTASYRAFCRGTAENGEAALEGMLSSLLPAYWPTAVIALNDLVAMGCMAAARKRGLQLPGDLSILGCDNLYCAPYLSPALTSIDTCQQELGANAVKLLLSGEEKRLVAKWEFVIRESCCQAKPVSAVR